MNQWLHWHMRSTSQGTDRVKGQNAKENSNWMTSKLPDSEMPPTERELEAYEFADDSYHRSDKSKLSLQGSRTHAKTGRVDQTRHKRKTIIFQSRKNPQKNSLQYFLLKKTRLLPIRFGLWHCCPGSRIPPAQAACIKHCRETWETSNTSETVA